MRLPCRVPSDRHPIIRCYYNITVHAELPVGARLYPDDVTKRQTRPPSHPAVNGVGLGGAVDVGICR